MNSSSSRSTNWSIGISIGKSELSLYLPFGIKCTNCSISTKVPVESTCYFLLSTATCKVCSELGNGEKWTSSTPELEIDYVGRRRRRIGLFFSFFLVATALTETVDTVQPFEAG